MKNQERVIYLKEDEIQKIIEKISHLHFQDLKKKFHYEISIMGKNVDEDIIKNYFKKFEKIKMIHYRERLTGYNNYDFFYVRDDGTYIIYSINLDKKPPELINAIIVRRNFEKFKKHIMKKKPDN